jgi:pimeloyl-ACP methyl ester carboxylesterase
VPAAGVRIAVETTTWEADLDTAASGDATLTHPVIGVHATGMCKEVLHPFVSALVELMPSGRVVTLDQRGHGDSDEAPPPISWWDLGADVLAVVADPGLVPPRSEIGGSRPVGVGHSSGGAALVMAELLAPGTFSALVLVEPIVFPPGAEIAEDHPMVRAALRRRAVFDDVVAARANFAGKAAFAGWEPAAFDAYVRHGLVAGPGGVTLKCRPDVEAEFYRAAVRHGAWSRLDEVQCPVVLVGGEHSNSHPVEFLEAMAARFPTPPAVELIAGASHFVMMQRSAHIAGLVAGLVAGFAPGSSGSTRAGRPTTAAG